ncbi:hydrogenase [Nitratiruptor sp. SB155-2]|uniref:hydrogenase n=1 Tax=Nitratiruptor sp. (strain SB155-2) TaxID=387092 RepID=UPI00015872EC|nr:hydrogenase [Nitratiruptor sp. SB155-2]BAF69831.1 Ni-Fe hydrogenase, membrane subunit HyfE [Nitratiruptor sp. SB155-2]
MGNFFIGLFLSTLITAILTTRLYRLFVWYALNSIFLGAAAIIIGSNIADTAMIVSGSITIALKGFFIPYILKYFSKKFDTQRDIQPSIKIQYSILLIPAILVFTFYLVDPVLHSFNKNYISLSIASLFLALLLMIEHKAIFPKIIGFLILENALFLLAMSATQGMPMLIELGIFFDLLMAVVIINLLLTKEVRHV